MCIDIYIYLNVINNKINYKKKDIKYRYLSKYYFYNIYILLYLL